MNNVHRRSGFTIVELLIVVVVIAILAAITIVAYNGIQNRAKASAAQSAASQVSKKIALWQVDNPNQTPSQETLNTLTASVSGTTLQYSPSSNGVYCITATTNGISYFFSNTSSAPSAGACFGHGVNGSTIIANLISNPSFESNTDGWGVSGNMTQSYATSGGANGARYFSGTRTTTAAIGLYSPQFEVIPGETYTGSANVRIPSGRQFFVRFRWFDAGNTEIQSNTGTTVTGSGSWQRSSYSRAAPTGAVTGRFDAVTNATNAATGDTLDLDGVIVTRGDTVYAYADGSSTGWSWQGATNNSASSGPPL